MCSSDLGGDPTPVGLRDRIKVQLTTVSFEEDGTQVWVEQTSTVTVTTEQERPSA